MSLLIEILQEVEQTEERDRIADVYNIDKNKENNTSKNEENVEPTDVLEENYSEKWTNEFLPEFSESLAQDFSDDNTLESEQHYYEQPIEEFFENAESHKEISVQDIEIFEDLEDELESSINESDESEKSLLLPSLELSSDEENAIETTDYDEEELIESVKSDNISDSKNYINEEINQQLTESTKEDNELSSNSSEISAKSANEYDTDSETFVGISTNIVDKMDLLKENQYVISAQTLMDSHRANRKKWKYAILFAIFLGASGFIAFFYEDFLNFVNIQSENTLLPLSTSGNLNWKRPSKQATLNETVQKDDTSIETAPEKQTPLNTDEKLEVSEKSVESSIESESSKSSTSSTIREENVEKSAESNTVQAKMLSTAESLSNMIKTRFSATDDKNNDMLQKVAEAEIDSKTTNKTTENETTNEPSEEKEGIKVIRKSKPRYLNDNLSKAYTAFQRGDDENAQIIYNKVLEQEPKNRDALLGLAAIALKKGNSQKALQFYQQVLTYYPQDKVAQVGLITTQGVEMLEETESHLKFMLSQSPTAAFIHFSLANFYAQNNRWAEAQQAYIQAFEYDNQRADYAYNLAVSLEHLQQKQEALYYYQQALQLAQSQAINFDIKMTEQRIKVLENLIKSNN